MAPSSKTLVAALPVQAARRREDESSYAGGLRRLREPNGGIAVDVVRELRVHIRERVIGQRGEVNDGVEANQIGRSDVAQVDSKGRYRIGRSKEVAFGEKVGVKTDNLMAEIDKKRRHLHAEVAQVAGDQDSHARRHFPPRRAMFAST